MENRDALRISKEVRKEDSDAEHELRAKCKWEHMTRMAVILEWGDPRTWPRVIDALVARIEKMCE